MAVPAPPPPAATANRQSEGPALGLAQVPTEAKPPPLAPAGKLGPDELVLKGAEELYPTL